MDRVRQKETGRENYDHSDLSVCRQGFLKDSPVDQSKIIIITEGPSPVGKLGIKRSIYFLADTISPK